MYFIYIINSENQGLVKTLILKRLMIRMNFIIVTPRRQAATFSLRTPINSVLHHRRIREFSSHLISIVENRFSFR